MRIETTPGDILGRFNLNVLHEKIPCVRISGLRLQVFWQGRIMAALLIQYAFPLAQSDGRCT